jgi:hypothetical protein
MFQNEESGIIISPVVAAEINSQVSLESENRYKENQSTKPIGKFELTYEIPGQIDMGVEMFSPAVR